MSKPQRLHSRTGVLANTAMVARLVGFRTSHKPALSGKLRRDNAFTRTSFMQTVTRNSGRGMPFVQEFDRHCVFAAHAMSSDQPLSVALRHAP